LSETTPEVAPARRSYLASAQLISACIFLSRVLGLAREILSASVFGAGWVMDAFVMAFQVPNLFRKLFGEGALSAAVIPVYADHLANRTREESNHFASAVTTLLGVFLSGVAVLLMGVAAVLPHLLKAPLDHPEKLSLPAHLLMVMLPYLPLVCVVAVLTAILNCHKHFLMPSLASVALNVCWIAGFLAAPHFGSVPQTQVYGIAVAILVGGVIELAMQIPPLRGYGVVLRPTLDWKGPGVREVLRLMGPTVFGLAIIQVNLLLDTIIAKSCVPGDGAVSVLNYGNRLMQFPLALIGIALAQAVFPFFADHVARGETDGLRRSVDQAMRVSNFVSIPATAGLAVLAGPIVDLLFNWKSFSKSPDAFERTVLVVACYAIGVWSYCAVQVLNRAFYALRDTRTPVRAGIASVVVNVALNLTLVWWLREAGLALATAIASVVNQVILRKALAVKIGRREGTSTWAILRPIFASAIMATLTWEVAALIPFQILGSVLLTRLVRVLVPLCLGAGTYVGLAVLLQAPEIKELLSSMRRRSK